jgi:hypothetical protein
VEKTGGGAVLVQEPNPERIQSISPALTQSGYAGWRITDEPTLKGTSAKLRWQAM